MKHLIMGYSQFVNEMYNANEEAANQPAKSVIPEGFITPENITDAEGGKAKLSELQSKYAFKADGNPIAIDSNDLVKFYHGAPGPFAQAKQDVMSTINTDIRAYEIQNAKTGIYYRILKGSGLEDPAATVDVVGVLAGPNQAEETPTATETPAAEPAPAAEPPVAQTEPVKEAKTDLLATYTQQPLKKEQVQEIMQQLLAEGFEKPDGTVLTPAELPDGQWYWSRLVGRDRKTNAMLIQKSLEAKANSLAAKNMTTVMSVVLVAPLSSDEVEGVGFICMNAPAEASAGSPTGVRGLEQTETPATASTPVYEAKRYIRNK